MDFAPPAPLPPVAPSPRRRIAMFALVLGAAILLAYANSFVAPFVLDDAASIADNASIRHLWPPGPVLSPPAHAGVGGRPVANLSFAICYALGGTRVGVYHAANLAIHLAAALALFGLVRRTLALPRLRPHVDANAVDAVAFGAALLWSLHPLQTEAVTYLSQRTESLMALFYLLAAYGFVRRTQESSLRWPLLAVAASALGMGTKETMVTAPVLLLLFDRTFVAGSFRAAWRERRGLYAALAATWIVLLFLLVDVHERGVGYAAVTGWHYALTESRAILLYLKLAGWPAPLVFDYGTDVAPGLSAVWPYALGLGALVAATLVALRRAPMLGFIGAGVFLLLAPASSVVPVAGQPVAEHRMYLPLAVLAAGASVALARVFRGRALVACSALALLLGIATFTRNRDYRTALALWEDTVAKRPLNPRALASLGAAQLEAGRLQPAIATLTHALTLDPRAAEAHNNLATALVDVNDAAGAVAHFSQSLALHPGTASTHYNFGNALLSLGRTSEAIAQQEQALVLQAEFPEARCALANAQLAAGRTDDAIENHRAALRLRPDLTPAHYGLANALAQAGRAAEAVPHYEATLRAAPNSAEVHYNFANLLFAAGHAADALPHYAAAVQLKPDFAEAHNNLANACALTGRFEEAIAHYTTALKLDPTLTAARTNLEAIAKKTAAKNR